MATAYVGVRPVLKGRSSAGMVHPYKGTVGKYSFWVNWSDSHVLDGAPDNHYVPGTGRHPGNVLMSQLFTGSTLYVHPLAGLFLNGTGQRFDPKTFKGLTGARAFPADFGHADRVSEYSYNNSLFDGVPAAAVLANVGHGVRTDKTGAAASFGTFIPEVHNGVTSAVVFNSAFGQPVPTGYDNEYGHNRVKEYRGVSSAKAL